MNWLDALDPDDPEVVSLSGALADMLVIGTGGESDPHWNDTARELLRGLLVHVATLPPERRSMAELRRILTASEDDLAVTLAEMLAEPERGQRLPARTATAHLNRPERERGSVLSTAIRHTAWLDDPRLCAALTRSDFSLRGSEAPEDDGLSRHPARPAARLPGLRAGVHRPGPRCHYRHTREAAAPGRILPR